VSQVIEKRIIWKNRQIVIGPGMNSCHLRVFVLVSAAYFLLDQCCYFIFKKKHTQKEKRNRVVGFELII
jgi:hypothetical protein